jgi:hypothetical protein
MVWASKPSGGHVYGFESQNPGRDYEEKQTTHGCVEEFASRRNYLIKGAVAVG